MDMQATTMTSLDEPRAAAFADDLARTLNAGAVAVMISIGHRAGLFDVLARMPPASSDAIAGTAALAERYVREWLAVMVTAGIVTYEPGRGTYSLPAEHAASLTRGGRLGNMAVYAQSIAMMGAMQEPVLACFETGAGLRYEDYPRFHHIMAEDSAQTVTAQMFSSVLPLVDGLEAALDRGIEVLDAGCGCGTAMLALAARFPRSRFTGYDLCADAIELAASAARDAGLGNARFEVQDLGELEVNSAYDVITSFDAVHDQRDPQDLLRRLYRALRPGGTFLMQDIGGSARLENNGAFAMAPLLYAISCVHCTPVSIGQGGVGLGTMWGWETALDMLQHAGFALARRHVLPHDPMNVWFVATRPAGRQDQQRGMP